MVAAYRNCLVFLSRFPHARPFGFIQVGPPVEEVSKPPLLQLLSAMSFPQDSKHDAASLSEAEKQGQEHGMSQTFATSISHANTQTTNSTADLEAIALPDFDDPNIDKDAAIAGILGTYFCFLIPGPYLADALTQRTTHHIPKSVPPSLTLTIPISL